MSLERGPRREGNSIDASMTSRTSPPSVGSTPAPPSKESFPRRRGESVDDNGQAPFESGHPPFVSDEARTVRSHPSRQSFTKGASEPFTEARAEPPFSAPSAEPARPSPERKYQMIRVGKGDYLLPANNLTTLWRIHSYEEDGSAYWEDAKGKARTIRGTFWNTSKFRGTFDDLRDGVLDDPTDWAHWETWGTMYRTRAEAIKDVLRV